MKKMILSLIVMSAFGTTAFAQQKMHHRSCPAASCTDHSYDQAYTSPANSMYRDVSNAGDEIKPMRSKKHCPASSCTDHSYDKAYSGGRPQKAAITNSPGNIDEAYVRPSDAWKPVITRTRDDAYSMNDYTFYGRNSNPNPYNGDDAPSYDGAAKNAYRNMRANNDSEPLPSSTGK